MVESKDVVINVKNISGSMSFRIMEDRKDISKEVTEMHFLLKEGRVYSIEMTYEDGSVWTAELA